MKKITKKFISIILNAISSLDLKEKNLLTLRAEKLAKVLNEHLQKCEKEINEKRAEFAVTDEKGNFIYEEVTITDKQGNSRTENTGNYKFTHSRLKNLEAAIETILKEEVEIPVYVIPLAGNEALYREAIKKYPASVLTVLSGILLQIPLDSDGFIEEKFYMEWCKEEVAATNGAEKQPA